MNELPEQPGLAPLSRRADRLGELLRQGNVEFQKDIDTRRALLRLEEKRERQRRPWRAQAFALSLSALLLGAFYAWGLTKDGSLTASSRPVPAVAHPVLPAQPVALAHEPENSFGSGQTRLPDGSSVHMEAQSRARWRRTHGGIRVRLDAGQVRCAVTKQRAGKRFVVEAGGYSFVVLGTELKVVRDAAESRLDVFSGRVEVREGTRSIAFVSAGGSWKGPTKSEVSAASDEVADEEPKPVSEASSREAPKQEHALREKEAPALVEDCAGLLKQQAFAPAAACYGRQSQGAGLGAEFALFELARLRLSAFDDPDSAVSVLEEHQRRFASGALSRQVQVALTRALAAQKRKREAQELVP